jgi:outer membrane lipoprotein SlyB
MADPVKSGEDKWLNSNMVIGAVAGAVFGGVIEYVFIGQGATLVAAALFGVFGAVAPALFE